MEFSPAALDQLKSFGLPAYAARAYLALLQLGVGEARGVGELARIPVAKVYGTLSKLQQLGLVEVSPGKPRKYAPEPMAAFVARRVREMEARASDLRARADSIAELFPLVGTASLADRARTNTITGRRNIIERLREACTGVEDNVFAVMTPEFHEDPTTHRFFDQAAQRGIKVHIAQDAAPARLRPTSAVLPAARSRPGAGVMGETMLMATFDHSRALLVHLVSYHQEPEHGAHEVALHTTEPAFVHMLRRAIALQFILQQGGPPPGDIHNMVVPQPRGDASGE